MKQGGSILGKGQECLVAREPIEQVDECFFRIDNARSYAIRLGLPGFRIDRAAAPGLCQPKGEGALGKRC